MLASSRERRVPDAGRAADWQSKSKACPFANRAFNTDAPALRFDQSFYKSQSQPCTAASFAADLNKAREDGRWKLFRDAFA